MYIGSCIIKGVTKEFIANQFHELAEMNTEHYWDNFSQVNLTIQSLVEWLPNSGNIVFDDIPFPSEISEDLDKYTFRDKLKKLEKKLRKTSVGLTIQATRHNRRRNDVIKCRIFDIARINNNATPLIKLVIFAWGYDNNIESAKNILRDFNRMSAGVSMKQII